MRNNKGTVGGPPGCPAESSTVVHGSHTTHWTEMHSRDTYATPQLSLPRCTIIILS